jgi:hypothetical protein
MGCDGTACGSTSSHSALENEAHSNSLGYYKIAANGTISDVHVLIDSTLNMPAAARAVNLGT